MLFLVRLVHVSGQAHHRADAVFCPRPRYVVSSSSRGRNGRTPTGVPPEERQPARLRSPHTPRPLRRGRGRHARHHRSRWLCVSV